MVERNLHSNKQYGYKKDHSTEMLFVKIVDELLMACDNKKPTLLLLLDLSAAFDTVDQNKLLKILHHEIGIRGKAFEWSHQISLTGHNESNLRIHIPALTCSSLEFLKDRFGACSNQHLHQNFLPLC